MTQRTIRILLIILVCTAALVCRPIFNLEYQIILLTGVIAFIGLIINSISKVLFEIRWLDILFVTTILYGLLNQRNLDLDITIRFLTLAGIWFYVKVSNSPRFNNSLLLIVVFAAIIQASIAFMQSFGVLSNNNYFFKATGLFNNPGPFGCFLSFSLSAYLPYIIIHYKSFSKAHKIIAVLVALLLFYGLLLADSRAAYLAAIVSLTAFAVIKFRSRVRIRIIHIGSLFFLFSGIVFLLYMYRPSSANARLSIWRICVHSIEDAPVFGYGTGSFQKTYMLKQADYLNNVSNEIRSNADEVKTAFNVPIELLYEQGIVGLLLWCSIVILSIKGMFTSTNKHNPPVFLFPIISFLTFSMFSYPHLIWGLTCPLISFLSIGGDYKDNIKLPSKPYKNLILGVESTLLTIMLFLFVSRVCINRNLTKYSRFEIDCQKVESNHLMNTILYHYPSLLSFYIDNQIATEDYDVAISTITQLRRYKNSYKLEKDLAYSYEITGDTTNALVHYDVAHNMCPGYLEPLFSQFLIYESRCDSIAVSLAKEIIDFSPKITNPRTEAMKSKTIQLLKTISNF